MAGGAAQSGRTVTSKVMAILMAFSRGGSHSLTELAGATGLPVSTTHRLVTELVARRLLERTAEGGYRIGLPLRMISSTGAAALVAPRIWERGGEVMMDLAAATRATVRLGVLDGSVVLESRARPGAAPTRAVAGPPPHLTALGHALLAFSPACVVEAAVEAGSERGADGTRLPEPLRRALGATRRTRVAVQRRQEAWCVAMPVFGAGGALLAALELEVPDARRSLAGARAALTVATGSLSRTLATPDAEGERSADHDTANHS